MDLGLDPIIAEIRQERDALRARVAELETTVKHLKGAMDSQDERERQAGEQCGVDYEAHGCDWPDAVAEKVIVQRQRIAGLEQENAGLAASLEVLRREMFQRWVMYCTEPHGNTVADYCQYLRQMGDMDVADAMADPSAALSRYRDGVLEEAAKKFDALPQCDEWGPRDISSKVRAMKGGR